MKILKLTEWGADSKFHPTLINFDHVLRCQEAELKENQPHIIGETKPVGIGSVLIMSGQHVVVKETVEEIHNALNRSA